MAGPQPRLAVSVGIWRSGRILLIRRARPPLEGLWTFPGGHVEPGEAVADAVSREALEETGLAIRLVGTPLLHEIVLRDDAGCLLSHHVLLVHAGLPVTDAEPVAASDAAEARFFHVAEVEALRTTPRLLHFIRETQRLTRIDP